MAKHVNKKYFDDNGNLIIKPYRIIDLATIFDVNRKTMCRWLNNYPEELGKKMGNYFSIKQVEFMIGQFGLPKKIFNA
ncbi:MAG: hypothetical protein QM764_08920 [Chitinophagaceae bacterium]